MAWKRCCLLEIYLKCRWVRAWLKKNKYKCFQHIISTDKPCNNRIAKFNNYIFCYRYIHHQDKNRVRWWVPYNNPRKTYKSRNLFNERSGDFPVSPIVCALYLENCGDISATTRKVRDLANICCRLCFYGWPPPSLGLGRSWYYTPRAGNSLNSDKLLIYINILNSCLSICDICLSICDCCPPTKHIYIATFEALAAPHWPIEAPAVNLTSKCD